MRTVFLAITHGWQARLLLRSSFLSQLFEQGGADLRVVVLSPGADEPYFQEEFGDRCQLRKIGPQSVRTLQRYDWIRRSLLLDAKPSTSHQILMNVQRKTAWKRYWAIRTLNACFRRSRLARRLYRALDRAVFQDREFGALFAEFEPDLLVIASTVHNEAFHLLRRARREGVRTLYVVESWDNPTCKMSFVEYPDHYLVWNHIMRRELEQFHGIPSEVIGVTGSAYHDVYAQAHTFRPREALAVEYGMDPAARWIVVAGTLETLYPDFDRFISDLEARRARGEFGDRCQILIRPHPQAIAGYSRGHGVAELDALRRKYPNVFYDVPRVLSQKLPVDVETSDIRRLAEILAHADVVISFLSTVTIDACALDTPVVLAGFDDYGHMTWFPTMGKRLQFDHHRNVVATGAVRIGRTFDEIAAHVRAYLDDRSLDRTERQRLVREQCFRVDGESGRRMALAVLASLDGRFKGGEIPETATAIRVPSHAV